LSFFNEFPKFQVGCTQDWPSCSDDVTVLVFPARWRCSMTSQNGNFFDFLIFGRHDVSHFPGDVVSSRSYLMPL
jgi:hypothetical protein